MNRGEIHVRYPCKACSKYGWDRLPPTEECEKCNKTGWIEEWISFYRFMGELDDERSRDGD